MGSVNDTAIIFRDPAVYPVVIHGLIIEDESGKLYTCWIIAANKRIFCTARVVGFSPSRIPDPDPLDGQYRLSHNEEVHTEEIYSPNKPI